MALAPLLQVRVVLRTRTSSGVSLSWLVVLLIGFVLWLSYGLAIGDLSLVLTNITSCAVCTATIAVVIRFRRVRAPDRA